MMILRFQASFRSVGKMDSETRAGNFETENGFLVLYIVKPYNSSRCIL